MINYRLSVLIIYEIPLRILQIDRYLLGCRNRHKLIHGSGKIRPAEPPVSDVLQWQGILSHVKFSIHDIIPGAHKGTFPRGDFLSGYTRG